MPPSELIWTIKRIPRDKVLSRRNLKLYNFGVHKVKKFHKSECIQKADHDARCLPAADWLSISARLIDTEVKINMLKEEKRNLYVQRRKLDRGGLALGEPFYSF